MATYDSDSDTTMNTTPVKTGEYPTRMPPSDFPIDNVVLTPVPTSTNPFPTPVLVQPVYPPEITELTAPVTGPSEVKEINSINVDLTDITQGGGARRIIISGAPGTPFTMTIVDKYGNNMLAPTKTYSKILNLAITSSRLLNVDNTDYLEVGMQLRVPGVGDGVTISSIKDNKNIIISKPQTISANTNLTFSGGSLLDDAIIPQYGVYSFSQSFPTLRTYTKTLKTAASSATALTLDTTINLEIGMRMTGTGVDGNNVIIETIDSDTQVTVSVAQTIADETTLAFTMSYNRYDILIRPHKGSRLSSDIPYKNPTYYIEQHIDPTITFTPTISLASSTVTGDVSLTKPAGHIAEATPPGSILPTGTTAINEGLVTISMVASSTSGGFVIDRQPRFSDTNSTLSDFTNTSTIHKPVTVYSGVETPIVVLNNTTGLAVGMRVTGNSIVQPVVPTDCKEVQSPINPEYRNVTIKSITGNTVTLTWPQTIPCESTLTFSNGGTSVYIGNLKAVLSEYVEGSTGIANAVCTVTGTGVISKFGKDSIACTIDFDNFLSKA